MMRYQFVFALLLGLFPLIAAAQKYAYIDSEYILAQITEYKAAQSKIDAMAEEWSTELTEKRAHIESMQRSFKAEQVLLTASMREEKMAEIKEKEAELEELQSKRFGYEGELWRKQQELIKPLQDRIYEINTNKQTQPTPIVKPSCPDRSTLSTSSSSCSLTQYLN